MAQVWWGFNSFEILYEEVLSISRNILTKLNYTGVIMIEFMIDERDGLPKLIEVNPRFWGSVLLSEFSGVQIVNNYVRLCNGLFPVKSDFTPKQIRWVYPIEILNLFMLDLSAIKSFIKDKNTCYINYTYSSLISRTLFRNLIILLKLFK